MQFKLGKFVLILVLSLYSKTILSDSSELKIDYELFTLNNGLTVIVHEDRKAPIVAVNIWYHVGSKNERSGRSGFAHLFEHLMFQGSENYDDEFFRPFEIVGATGQNGTTNKDRTNYFQNVPTTALDMALWMESDRMGHLLGAITEEKLAEQRKVVQNEKRQGENQPYGRFFEIASRLSYPAGHPYSWTTIGSMQDLEAAKLEDVKDWFNEYYGPSNAVLVLAGDIDLKTARQKVELYFGDIKAGKPLEKPDRWVAKRNEDIRELVYDNIPQTRFYLLWNVANYGNRESDILNIASSILASGKNSRLYRRLIEKDKLVSSVYAQNSSQELGGLFLIIADVLSGIDPKLVEEAINEEILIFLSKGPTKKELKRTKTRYRSNFIRGLERIGGFGGKSDVLAKNFVYTGDPGYSTTALANISEATSRDVKEISSKWLSEGKLTIEYRPFPLLSSSERGVARDSGPPMPDSNVQLSFPQIEHSILNNGIPLTFAKRSEAPLVSIKIMFDAGFASDFNQGHGRASFATKMLLEGTMNRSGSEISEQLELLGSLLTTSANLDITSLQLSALKENLPSSIDIFSDVIRNPSFDPEKIELLRSQLLAKIEQEKNEPVSLALRALPPLIYGDKHAYGEPGLFTGTGSKDSIEKMTRDDLVSFQDTWLRPVRAHIVAVGDTTIQELQKLLNSKLGNWTKSTVSLITKTFSKSTKPKKSRFFLLDRKDAQQTIIIAGHLASATGENDEVATTAANDIIGGTFTSRINMNLREEKGWAYGARTLLPDAQQQRPFIVYAPVQTDKTIDAILELKRELLEYVSNEPATQKEVAKVVSDNVNSLPGLFETQSSVMGLLSSNVRFSRPDSYIFDYEQQMLNLDYESVRSAATELIFPDALTWIIVGDLNKIESKIRALNFGNVRILDSSGKIVE